MQPEQLARPEGFRNLVDFIAALQAPTSPFLPSEWTADIVMNWLTRVGDPLPIALLWSTAGAFVVFGRPGCTSGSTRRATPRRRKARSTYRAGQAAGRRCVRACSAGCRWPGGSSSLKDVRLFFRDTTQWSQLILLAVLLLVYVFNIRALPLFTGEKVPFCLVTMVVFLNQGLAGFVLAAIAARFIFPSVSLEGKQLWLLRSSPLDLEALLWSKYWTGTVPLLVLALVITFITNMLLQASPFMMVVSIGTITLYTVAASAMALGFGTFFPSSRPRTRRRSRPASAGWCS